MTDKSDKDLLKQKTRSFKIKDKIEFHRHLTKLLELKKNQCVLDLGCGHGHTLMYIAEALAGTGKVIGVDIDEKALSIAREMLQNGIRSGHVELQVHDLSKKLPFPKMSFDRMVSHNVLECIPDKIGFLNDCYDALKKDGLLVMAHSDWDTQLYNSSFPILTRKLVHNYADTTQDWMEVSDGSIGRKLPEIFHKTKFSKYASEVYVISNTRYVPLEYGYRIAQDIVNIAKKSGSFDEKELKQWINDLKRRDKGSAYFYSSIINIILAKK